MNRAPLRCYRISGKTKFHHKDTKDTKKLTANGYEWTRRQKNKSNGRLTQMYAVIYSEISFEILLCLICMQCYLQLPLIRVNSVHCG